MNQNRHFPDDDHADTPMSSLERQLQQLQPRPAAFDAATIIRAAGAPDRHVMLPERRLRQLQPRTARWLAMTACWMCGAVVGGLLTWLVLLPHAAESPATASGESRHLVVHPSPAKTSAESHENQPREEAVSRRDHRHADAPQWSQDEWFISAQLLDLPGPQVRADMPLIAGHFVLRSFTTGRSVKEWVAHQGSPSTTSGDENQRLLERTTRPPLSVNTDSLLEELLGPRPGSRL